jgi:hypothetical protein
MSCSALPKLQTSKPFFGAKYLIYDPFKIMKKINIHSWKIRKKIQLAPIGTSSFFVCRS